MPIIAQTLDEPTLPVEQLAKASLTAIGQHHSPRSGLSAVNRSLTLPSIKLETGSLEVVRTAVGTGSRPMLSDDQPSHRDWQAFLDTNIRRELRPHAAVPEAADDWTFLPMTTLFTRIVRLADQRGTRAATSS